MADSVPARPDWNRQRTFLQSTVHVMAQSGNIELFEPKQSLIKVPKKGEEGIMSFRREAELLMKDMDKWTEVKAPLFMRMTGYKHYKNVNNNGGVGYLSVGTINVSAKLATELCFKQNTNAEMKMNASPAKYEQKVKILKEVDENTVIIENQLRSPGGPCHTAFLVMKDDTGGMGLVLQYSITKAPEGVTIKPLKTIDGEFKQAYGMVAHQFTPIKGREKEAVCEFRFLHQWWENKGHTGSEEDSEIVDSKDVPVFVAELIFRKQIKNLHHLAGLDG